MRRVPRLSLFTGPHCSLCDTAKQALAQVRAKTPFELSVVNIQDTEQEHWKRKYVYDIPVLHVEDKLVAKGIWGTKEIEEGIRSWSLNKLP